MHDYEEACPISRAVSVLGERWTIQIIREMFFGATRFNELQQYLPKMSPTLLNSRLKSLEQAGIILRKKIPEKRGHEYHLTPCGQALKPVLQEVGKWGMRWVFDSMDPEELNVSTLVRDFAVALNTRQLPAGSTTLQFNVVTENETAKKFVLVRDGATQVCDENIGTEVDIYLTASLLTYGKIWFGELPPSVAVDRGLLKVVGESHYVNNLSRWLGVSQFAPLNTQREANT